MTTNEDVIGDARTPLEPVSESELSFRGHKIKTVTLQNGQGFVVLRSLCDAFGLNYSGQRQRAQRTDIFQDHSALIYIATTGGRQAQPCLSAFAVPAFLLGVETARVASEEARALLDAFQEEGMIVLAEHFGLSERGEIQFLRESLARMVVQQDRFEAQLEDNKQAVDKAVDGERLAREEKVNQIRDAFLGMREEIRTLKQTIGPQKRLTPEQIGSIREMVMILGQLQIQAGESKRPWPAIYSDITLAFGFSKVEDITQEIYPQVEKFLDGQVQAFRTRILKGQEKPT